MGGVGIGGDGGGEGGGAYLMFMVLVPGVVVRADAEWKR